jgi:hypothetical protein
MLYRNRQEVRRSLRRYVAFEEPLQVRASFSHEYFIDPELTDNMQVSGTQEEISDSLTETRTWLSASSYSCCHLYHIAPVFPDDAVQMFSVELFPGLLKNYSQDC